MKIERLAEELMKDISQQGFSVHLPNAGIGLKRRPSRIEGSQASRASHNVQTSDRERKDPTVSPPLASSQQLAGSPRTLIITAENDVLRDEGEAHNRKLIGAGVEVVTNTIQRDDSRFRNANWLNQT